VSLPPVLVSQRSFVGSRSRNEDCIGVEQSSGHWCLVLSDGAGGHSDGEVAARVTVDRVLAGFRSRPPVDARDLAELLLDAHDAVIAAQRARGNVHPATAMHATVVALIINVEAGHAFWGHVGDSRLYLCRDGRVTAMTRDDSVLQWMLDAGVIDAEREKNVAKRGSLLAALGADQDLEPHVFGPFVLQQADAFLLCSDGWWTTVDEVRIDETICAAASPEQWLDAMAAETARRADAKQDNYSAIACWIGERAGARAADTGTIPVIFPHLRQGSPRP
jgi:serine/threonine protein phosphatase PrpC